MWWVFIQKQVFSKYIYVIKDMDYEAISEVAITRGETKLFPFTISLHQGSTLSPCFFVLVTNELTLACLEWSSMVNVIR